MAALNLPSGSSSPPPRMLSPPIRSDMFR
jgi:hypothetical protein